MKKLMNRILLALFFSLCVGTVNATLITDEITVRAVGDDGVTCIVGGGCDGMGDTGFSNLLVGANTISIDVNQWLNGYTIEFLGLDWVGMPDGILLDVEFNSIGCCYNGSGEPNIFDVTDHGFKMSYMHLVPDQGEIIVMRMITNHDVPEPSTLAIFALGMIGLASRRFKKQS